MGIDTDDGLLALAQACIYIHTFMGVGVGVGMEFIVSLRYV